MKAPMHRPALAANIIAAALCLAPLTVMAGEGTYLGINLGQVAFTPTGADTVDSTTLGLVFGANINSNLALESRFGTGLTSSTMEILGQSSTFEINSYLSGYLKGILPLSDAFSVYGLAGVALVDVNVKSGLASSSTYTDMSFGVGAHYSVADYGNLTVDYVQLTEDNDHESAMVAVGFSVFF